MRAGGLRVRRGEVLAVETVVARRNELANSLARWYRNAACVCVYAVHSAMIPSKAAARGREELLGIMVRMRPAFTSLSQLSADATEASDSGTKAQETN